MDWLELKVIFEAADPALAADLVADVFYEAGLQGVVVESPGWDPEADWGNDAVPPPEHHAVIGYLPGNASLAQRRGKVAQGLEDLARRLPALIETRARTVRDEDWSESWKAFFHPERVGRRIVVKPTWHAYAAERDDIVLEIDPGMAFGTGTHPTTRLCVGMIEDHLQPGDAVLDVGTGSGILLLAAARLGAGRLDGADIDDVAVAVAGDNLSRNGVAPASVCLWQGTIARAAANAYDLVVANILSEVIVPLVPEVARALRPGGLFVASGIVAANAPAVEAAMAACGFAVADRRELEGWVALAARQGDARP